MSFMKKVLFVCFVGMLAVSVQAAEDRHQCVYEDGKSFSPCNDILMKKDRHQCVTEDGKSLSPACDHRMIKVALHNASEDFKVLEDTAKRCAALPVTAVCHNASVQMNEKVCTVKMTEVPGVVVVECVDSLGLEI